MRPQSIAWFEQISLALLAIGLLGSGLYWNATLAALKASGDPDPILSAVIGILGEYGIGAALILLISRGRRKLAIWALIGFIGSGPLFDFGLLPNRADARPMPLIVLPAVGQLAACALLFTPNARRWFDKGREISPEIFR